MLMQNFMSAADLGITEPQKDALIKTLVLMETGKLEHSKAFDFDRFDEVLPRFTGEFNMRYWAAPGTNCGTIACIGGTAELIGDVDFSYQGNRDLLSLFQPQTVSIDRWGDITPAQAARALRSFLQTGDAKWSEAVA